MSKIIMKENASTPDIPSLGKRLIYPKADGWYERDSSGVESKIGASPVFGTEFQEVSKISTETNGTSTLSTYLSVTQSNPVIGAKYRIAVRLKYRMNNNSRNYVISVLRGGIPLDINAEDETKDSGADIRRPYSEFFYDTDSDGLSKTIELQYAPENGSDTMTVYSGAIEVWRVE